MTDTMTLNIGQRGTVTLPKSARDRYNIRAGDKLTFLDLGNGVFVLSTRPSRIDEMANRLSQALIDHGESLESMLHALREERERYGD